MRRLLLILCALVLAVGHVGCTDPADNPKKGDASSGAPAKQDGKTDS